jgi:hypothetical protein
MKPETYQWTCKGQTYTLTNPDWSAIADACWEGGAE